MNYFHFHHLPILSPACTQVHQTSLHHPPPIAAAVIPVHPRHSCLSGPAPPLQVKKFRGLFLLLSPGPDLGCRGGNFCHQSPGLGKRFTVSWVPLPALLFVSLPLNQRVGLVMFCWWAGFLVSPLCPLTCLSQDSELSSHAMPDPILMVLWVLKSTFGEGAGGLHLGPSPICVCPSRLVRGLFFWGPLVQS